MASARVDERASRRSAVVDPLRSRIELNLRLRDESLGLLAVTPLVLPDGFVGLLRGRDPLVGIVERDSRLLEVGVTAERLGGEEASGSGEQGGQGDNAKLRHVLLSLV